MTIHFDSPEDDVPISGLSTNHRAQTHLSHDGSIADTVVGPLVLISSVCHETGLSATLDPRYREQNCGHGGGWQVRLRDCGHGGGWVGLKLLWDCRHDDG